MSAERAHSSGRILTVSDRIPVRSPETTPVVPDALFPIRKTIPIQQTDFIANLVTKSPLLSKMFSVQTSTQLKSNSLFDEMRTTYHQKREGSMSQHASDRSIENPRPSVMKNFRCTSSSSKIHKIVSSRRQIPTETYGREENKTKQEPKSFEIQQEQLPGFKDSLASVSTDSSKPGGKLLPFRMRSKSIDTANSVPCLKQSFLEHQQLTQAEPECKLSSNVGLNDLMKSVNQNRDFIIKKQQIPSVGIASPGLSQETSPSNKVDSFMLPSPKASGPNPSSFAEIFARRTQTTSALPDPNKQIVNTTLSHAELRPLASRLSPQSLIQSQPVQTQLLSGLRCRHDIASLNGVTPGKVKINQDYANFCKFATKGSHEARLYSLADGHGPFGDTASRLAVQMLNSQVQLMMTDLEDQVSNETVNSIVVEIIKTAFARVQKAFKSDKQARFRHSGTTMIFVMVFKSTLFIANLGDSKAIIGSAKDLTSPSPSISVCSFETKMHKPDNPSEKQRINSCGGLVEPYIDEITGETTGPPRVWNKQKMSPGLAISRTLGDILAHNVGVSSDPGRTPV